jgi:cytidylate kinase
MSQGYVKGYCLTREELDIELGIGADTSIVSHYIELFYERYTKHKKTNAQPILLLIGGFQGSGKTTALDVLHSDTDLVIIFLDEIRQQMLDDSIPLDNEFIRLVNSIKYGLLDRLLEHNFSIALDQALYPDRIAITKQILKRFPSYSLKTVFLNAPYEILVQRVADRPKQPNRYKGTVEQLEQNIKNYTNRYGDMMDYDFDMKIDTSKHDPLTVASLISQSLR